MKESLLLDVFIHASFFLAVAALIIPFLKRFKVPYVLGYLLAGIAFGPHGVGSFSQEFPILSYITLQNSDHVQILSDLGIVFLLFVIGLELTPKKLWQMRGMVFGLGSAQVLLSSVVIGGIAYAWGNSTQASILLGLGLSLSSTAIITQWLHERKLFSTQVGQTSFSILLLQDIAVIPILILITVFSAASVDSLASHISWMLAKMALAVVAIIVIGQWFLRPVFSFSNKYGGAEVFIALSFLVIAVTSSIAGMAGMSMALGAFIGGLLLADTHYSHEISSIIVPFKTMLLGIFFMSFGMTIDIHFILERTGWLLVSAFGLMAIKAVIIFGLSYVWKRSIPIAGEVALLLPQAGEFGLLVVGASLSSGLLDNDIAQFMFLTVGLTMMITPILTPLSQRFGQYLSHHEKTDDQIRKDIVEDDLLGHIVILGFGRMGKTIAEIVARQGVQFLAFDKQIDRSTAQLYKNAPVYYGDVTKQSTLNTAHIGRASCVVITIDDPSAAQQIYKKIRKKNPDTPVIIRAHKLRDFEKMKEEEGLYIVPEYLSTSLILAEKVLLHNGYSEEEAHAIAKENQGYF